MHVEYAAGLPGIAFVDLIPVAIQLICLVKMRPRLDRTTAAVFHLPAPENYFSSGVGGLKLQPDIERVQRAAGKEMSDLARSDNHVHARRGAGLELRLGLVEGRGDVAHFAYEGVALLLGFLSDSRT